MIVKILKWLPASWKTRIAEVMTKDNSNARRLNKDTLRDMLFFGKWTNEKEKSVLLCRDAMLHALLNDWYDVIVDDTNLHPKHVATITDIAKKYWADTEVLFIDTWVETCLERNSRRDKRVPVRAIQWMYDKSSWLEFKEYPVETYVGNEEMPKWVIVDIDWTLAKFNGREAYDWDKVINDLPEPEVIDLVKMYRDNWYKILIFTWRDWVCATDTKQWLSKHSVEWDEFHIRPEWNCEPDTIVKKVMFDKVKDKYNIKLCLDDRLKVVSLRRGLWIKTLQVNYWNF